MIRPVALTLLGAIALTGCAHGGTAGPITRWQTVATSTDRDRIRGWRDAWMDALPAARQADAAAVAAQGALFAPDQALADPIPPAGSYRCRVFRLGALHAGGAAFTPLPAAPCTIARDGALTRFTLAAGDQRPTGRLYSDSDTRAIFLGTLELGDERTALDYGQDDRRNSVGYVERVAPQRWRLVLPSPSFDARLDVIELTPG